MPLSVFCNAAVLNEAAAPPPPQWNNGTYDVTIHYIAVDRRFSEPFYIHIICNFVPREYRPIYKRMQPPPPNNSPLPRICDVILHYISVDRHFSVHFYKHFSFLRVYIEGGRSYCMYVPPRRQTLFNVHTDIDRRLFMYSCLYIRIDRRFSEPFLYI